MFHLKTSTKFGLHRDSTCTIKKNLPNSFDGKTCRWNNNGKYYYRNSNTPTPEMVMYQKVYRNYWDPTDPNHYEFKMTLILGDYGAVLGDYGAVLKIKIEDAGKSYIFGFSNKTNVPRLLSINYY